MIPSPRSAQINRGEPNFLPRLVACLVLVDGEAQFRSHALQRCREVNAKLGTSFGIAECETVPGAAEVVIYWLKLVGRMITPFSYIDAARIWTRPDHGHMDERTIPYWKSIECYFKSPNTTAHLKQMAGVKERKWTNV